MHRLQRVTKKKREAKQTKKLTAYTLRTNTNRRSRRYIHCSLLWYLHLHAKTEYTHCVCALILASVIKSNIHSESPITLLLFRFIAIVVSVCGICVVRISSELSSIYFLCGIRTHFGWYWWRTKYKTHIGTGYKFQCDCIRFTDTVFISFNGNLYPSNPIARARRYIAATAFIGWQISHINILNFGKFNQIKERCGNS